MPRIVWQLRRCALALRRERFMRRNTHQGRYYTRALICKDQLSHRSMPLVLECIKEIDQVLLLLICETDVEALVIKIHRVEQSGCRAVVEIGGARGQSPQSEPFDLADVGAVSRNQCAARIGDDISVSFEPTCRACEGENRQSGNVEGRKALGSGIGNADVQWRLD